MGGAFVAVGGATVALGSGVALAGAFSVGEAVAGAVSLGDGPELSTAGSVLVACGSAVTTVLGLRGVLVGVGVDSKATGAHAPKMSAITINSTAAAQDKGKAEFLRFSIINVCLRGGP